MDNLLIAVLGNRDSGKSHTWNTLFETTVRTSKDVRKLYFNDFEYVEVFLVSGSPEERKKYVGELIGEVKPRIVFCSIQYKEEAKETFNYFIDHNFLLFVHWLNPGFSDLDTPYFDGIGIIYWLCSKLSLVGIRSGKHEPKLRVNEMRDFIYGWAKSRDLLINKCV